MSALDGEPDPIGAEPACWSWPLPDPDKSDALRFIYFHADRCALCGREDPRLDWDHDHESGLLRGMLDRSCNVREGWDQLRGDHPGIAAYRERPPTVLLGIRKLWSPPREPLVYDRWRDNAMRGVL